MPIKFSLFNSNDLFQEVPKNTVLFWAGVCDFKNAASENPYMQVMDYVLGCLTIAHSTASFDWLFSMVSCVKSKLRNQLHTSTVEAVLRIRNYLKTHKLCCRSMVVSELMLKMFSNQMYLSEVMVNDENEIKTQLRRL